MARNIKEFLDEHRINYSRIEHPERFTAQGTAEVTHIKGKEMAKAVMVLADGRLCMVVVPSPYHVDFERLKRVLDAQNVVLAEESEFADTFPDSEVGAMPPFGTMYDVPTYVQRELSEDEEIAFNAGSHKELIRMAYADYARLVKPEVCDVASRLES